MAGLSLGPAGIYFVVCATVATERVRNARWAQVAYAVPAAHDHDVRTLRRLVFGTLVLAGVVVCLAIAARFSDGPLGPFPGGKLSGVPVTEPVTDWTALLRAVGHVELEVSPKHPRSLTTSYIVRDGVLYVPSMFAAHKRWPKEVLADDRVVLRIGGGLYERRAVRVTEPAEIRALIRARDASTRDDLDVGELPTWYFRIEPR